ncbi:MAG: CHAT domain-containing protein, partial [Candidatus Thermoplasmatota archaeon]|nr:CHAT domain-containing protein [Candidatus Thermoplasmatota archaeon]
NVIQEYELLYPLYRKANALQLMYEHGKKDVRYLKASVQTYDFIIALIDRIKGNLTEESNFLFTEKIQDIFYHSIKTSLLAYEITKKPVFIETTFKFIEKNKAAVLLSSIRSEDAIKFAGISEESQRLEKTIKKRISAYKKQIFDQKNLTKPDERKINLWESKLLYLHKSYDSLIARFGIENPEYYALKYDTTVINISEIKNCIGKSKALIQYAVFDKEIFISVITSDSSLIISKTVDSIFFHQIENLYKMFAVNMNNHNIDDFMTYILFSNNLYRLLFEPFTDIIKNKDLIIIPDGRLGYLPFETLITEIPDIDEIDYRSLPYLLKKHSVSYSYSSTLLFKNNLDSDIDDLKLLAFAPSYTNREAIENNSFIKNHNLSDYLIPLKQAKDEIDNISKIFKSTKCENSDASEKRFKELAPEYDILHLAMHTILNDTAPMYSKLVFTPSGDDEQDIFLNTYEVYNLDLKARMVVLSACNTGSGKLQKGEGIMSLARGFLYCGVPSIIMTLWEVNDRSGAGIMTDFYKNLKKGLPKDKALQIAKLNYLENARQFMAHPF